MLTPEDIRDGARQSGFRHVSYNRRDRPGPNSHGGGKRLFQAQSGRDAAKSGFFRGPMRMTADEAAQDYCSYINSGAAPATPALRSAGHNGRRDSLPDDPEVEAALGILRDAKAQAAGKQGFVYCIGENSKGFGTVFVKIGYSTNPQARVAELQTGNPRQLWLMGFKPGAIEDETALHQKYIRHNVLAEWFRPTKELLSEFDLQEGSTP